MQVSSTLDYPLSTMLLASCLTTLALTPPASLEPANPSVLRHLVGQSYKKCCKPGNRVGCDPKNLGQSGCVNINRVYPSCFAATLRTMPCTSAICVDSGPEDKCTVINRTIRHNRCRALGRLTTVGCPEDHWQCAIEMLAYTEPRAPASVVMVCLQDQSTICTYAYSVCD